MIKKKDFLCKNCGECCKPIVILNNEDIEKIKSLGYKESYFICNDSFNKNSKVMKRKDGKCIFLDFLNDKSYCRIYEHRPKICKEYPFIGKKQINDCKPKSALKESIEKAKSLYLKRGYI